MKRIMSLVLGLILILAVAAGCGRPDPNAVFRDALIKTALAKDSHVVAEVSVSNKNETLSIGLDAKGDRAARQHVATLTVGMRGQTQSVSVYIDKDTAYLALLPNAYLSFPLGDIDIAAEPDAAKIRELADSILADEAVRSSATIEAATETINGVELAGRNVSYTIPAADMKDIIVALITRITADPRLRAEINSRLTERGEEPISDVDIEKAIAELKDALNRIDFKELSYTAFITKQGYIARHRLAVGLTAQGETAHITADIRMFDFGEPATVAMPAFNAENTLSLEHYLEGMASLIGR